MKVITGYTKAYDMKGVDTTNARTRYDGYYISKGVSEEHGTELPKVVDVQVGIKIFEPDDLVLDNLPVKIGKINPDTQEIEDTGGRMVLSKGVDDMPLITEKDLTFFNTPLIKDLKNEEGEIITYSMLGMEAYLIRPVNNTTTELSYWDPADTASQKEIWESGKTIGDDYVGFNGKFNSIIPITEEEQYVPQMCNIRYIVPVGAGPYYTEDDIFKGSGNASLPDGSTVTGDFYEYVGNSAIYYGDSYGKGCYTKTEPISRGGLTFALNLYTEDGVELGKINKILYGVASNYDEYVIPDSWTNYNSNPTSVNVGKQHTSYAFGAKFANKTTIDDAYAILVSQNWYRKQDSGKRIAVTYSSLKDGGNEVLFGDTAITYGAVKYWFEHSKITDPTEEGSEDPYAPGGTSGPGGGDGTWDYTSDPIDIPQHPGQFAIDSGFLTTYIPTKEQAGLLADFLLSNKEIDGQVVNLFFNAASVVVKQFANPMDIITSFSVMPFKIPKTSELYEVKVGFVGTGLSFPKPLNQYVEVDCGTLRIEPITGSYLDYDSQIDLFLPYIGSVPMRPEDVFGKDVRVVYHVDIITGALACYIKVNDSVLYNYNGQCGQQIPLTANDYSNLLNAVVSAGTAIVGPVAAASGSALQAAKAGFTAKEALAWGGMEGASQLPSMADGLQSSLGASSIKPNIQKSGSISGPGGMLNIQKPYFTITTPNVCLPEGQKMYQGYPLMATRKLGDLKGFTTIHEIHLENIPCTMNELNQIYNLLKGGVIL